MSPQRTQGAEPKEFTLLPTSMEENISVAPCGNAMGTAVPNFICLNSLLLCLNLHIFLEVRFWLVISALCRYYGQKQTFQKIIIFWCP
jgi:hypothetical protein